MIPALSVVPLSDVESAFTLVIDKICQTADQFDIPTDIFEKIDKLASYFQKTYIKKETIGRQQCDPLFPPALWNHYDNAAAGLIFVLYSHRKGTIFWEVIEAIMTKILPFPSPRPPIPVTQYRGDLGVLGTIFIDFELKQLIRRESIV